MASSPHASGPASEPALVSIPLARNNRLLSFERRIKLWLLLAAVAVLTPSILLLRSFALPRPLIAAIAAVLAALCILLARLFFAQLLRPLQTLANIIAAIREQDYSFRARGGRRGDTVGDLTLEINALSGTLQQQRAEAQDALTLLERVLTSMQSPVLAFDADGRLRLLNTSAREAFALASTPDPLGRSATELSLAELLTLPDQGLYPPASPQSSLTSHPVRWSVRRATFRLHGLPHTLLVLSDVANVLREEERLAWQRLIRVLSHEINNSLTPIKSIAGSLRTRTEPLPPEDREDFTRGLSVIEERAASLHRFLAAYQRLAHLPAPDLRSISIADLASRTAQLETRLPISLHPGPTGTLSCDPDQVEQALINLLHNAVDAALLPGDQALPNVTFSWTVTPNEVQFLIEDNGPGIDNPTNLFVPFYTTKPKGSGIGLALAQQIATAHHGRVALLSKPGDHGCIASLTLPINPGVTRP